jgi:hypothetical protein
MKLQELIVKLQAIEKSKPGADVAFQFADVHSNGCTTRQAHLLDVEAESARQVNCLITVGNYEHDAALYKDHLETLRASDSQSAIVRNAKFAN